MSTEYIDQNRRFWEAATSIHLAGSELYPVTDFLNGKCSLKDIELEEVGNVRGKSLLHLQCHFGMDTLSWARRGAQVTGIDLSGKAISAAKMLSEKTGIKAHFLESNIYSVPEHISDTFDIVYTSYGVLCWLPDLEKWAEIISDRLKPQGIFYIVDFHPVFNAVAKKDNRLVFVENYFSSQKPADHEGGPDYANMDVVNPEKMSLWQHPLSEIITSLANAGLGIQFVHEFSKICFNNEGIMEKTDGDWFTYSSSLPTIPLMFSIKAIKE